jgi:hypothetical protein
MNPFQEIITAQTIQQNVKNRKNGSSPMQRGPKGSIPEIHYKHSDGIQKFCCHHPI